MPEFISVSASSYDPAALATKLTEKSSEGWEVVAIVPTGGDITAFLRRGASVEAGTVRSAAAAAAAVTSGPSPVVEPVGWGTTPAATSAPSPTSNAPLGMYGNGAGAGAGAGAYGSTQHATPQPASAQQASGPATAAATSSASGTPAGWYHDPSGRYELRYWNGSEWTEHVSRAGQQYTDPPVA